MFDPEYCTFSFWWIIPIFMMILCAIAMRRRWGSMMCGFGSRCRDGYPAKHADSAIEILDRRYASGDIDKTEYEEKKKTLTTSMNPKTD